MATATYRGVWERYAPEHQDDYPGLMFFRNASGVDLNSKRGEWLTDEAVTVSASLTDGEYLIRSVSSGGMCAVPLPEAPHLLTIEGWVGQLELLVRMKVDGATMNVLEA